MVLTSRFPKIPIYNDCMATTYTTQTIHEGQSRCISSHKASGEIWHTDIPVALGGLGFYASPAATLAMVAASCMMSMVAFLGYRKGVDTTGMQIDARADEEDGVIHRLVFRVTMPTETSPSLQAIFESAAETCPVRKSLHPKIEIITEWETF